jgi:adenylate kinase family enzyme
MVNGNLEALLLRRVRLRARLRVAWLRELWATVRPSTEAAPPLQVEIDRILDDHDAPAREAEWLATSPVVAALRPPLEEAEAALRGAGRLAELEATLGLSAWELDAVQTTLALALDPSLGRLFAYLQDDGDRPYVTEELVSRLYGHGRGDFLGPSAARRWSLLAEREVAPGGPRLLECDPWLRDWLLGGEELDPRLRGAARVAPPRPPLPSWPTPALSQWIQETLSRTPSSPVRLVLSGLPGSGRRSFGAALAAELGLHVTVIDADRLREADWEACFVAAQRQAFLDRGALAWTGERALQQPWPRSVPWFPLQFVVTAPGRQPLPEPGVLDRFVALSLPTVAERRSLWEVHRGDQPPWPEEETQRLATLYRATPGQIAQVVRSGARTPGEAAARLRDVTRRQLGELAKPLASALTWDDLVVPPTLRQSLDELVFEATERAALWEQPAAQRLFPQGRGLLALLAGPPGTGKTMAAQVIAGRLGYDLFRIDLSTVVSKYVGETSKHLEQLLSQAEELDVVLLFDEADSLFGQRTGVQDAHDRYANTDTSYLLQAIESFRGIALLASNKRANVDSAFMRRLRYVLEFPNPEEPQRSLLWRQLLRELAGPEQSAALEGSAASLSRAKLSGAQIKSSILTGLFGARRDGAPLTPAHLQKGIDRELLKEGRLVTTQARESWIRAASATPSEGVAPPEPRRPPQGPPFLKQSR